MEKIQYRTTWDGENTRAIQGIHHKWCKNLPIKPSTVFFTWYQDLFWETLP